MSSMSRLLIVLAVVVGSTQQLAAQPATPRTSSASVVLSASNSAAYKVDFEDVSLSIQSPKDVASGQATGKRIHKPLGARAGNTMIDAGHLSEYHDKYANQEISYVLSFKVLVNLVSEGGKSCKANVQTTLKPGATRLDVPFGDVARFFDASGNPRPELCAR